MKSPVFFFIFMLYACAPVLSAGRVALVVGNSAYANLPEGKQLRSPVYDAQDVADALSKMGYAIVGGRALTDASREAMATAAEQFSIAAKSAEAAVFYFSGHGIQVGEDNYLLPADTPKLTGISTLKNRCILLRDSIMVALEEAGASNKLIILDCCRENPFAAHLDAALAQVGKGIKTKGVGEISGYGPGFYLAFATSPGQVAADGNGQRNSPFTATLLNVLPSSAKKDIDFLFRDVKKSLPDDQVSWTNHSLKGSFTLAFNPLSSVGNEESHGAISGRALAQDPDVSISQRNSAIQVNPHSTSPEQMQLRIADGFFAKKQWNEAAPQYEKYLERFPKASEADRHAATFQLAESYRHAGSVNSAKVAYEKVLSGFLGEFTGLAAYRLASLLYDEKNYRQALPVFRRANVRVSEFQLQCAAKFFAARCLEAIGDKLEARMHYGELTLISGSNPYRDASRLSFAILLHDAKRSDEAFKVFVALADESTNAEIKTEAQKWVNVLETTVGDGKTK